MRLPTLALVAKGWLGTRVEGVTEAMVATTLPALDAWAATGFLQVRGVGGSPHPNLPISAPVATVSAWYASPQSSRPPMGKAADLAARVERAALLPLGLDNLIVTPPSYLDARVLEVRVIQHPTEVPDDESGYARLDLDLMFTWAIAE